LPTFGQLSVEPVVVGEKAAAAVVSDEVFLSPGGTGHLLVLSSSREGDSGTTSTAVVVDAPTGQRACQMQMHVTGGIIAAAAVPDEARVVLVTDAGMAQIWDMATGEMVASAKVPGSFELVWWGRRPVVFARGDKVLMLIMRTLYAWVPSSEEEARVVWGDDVGSDGTVLALSPDGEQAWVWQNSSDSLVQMDTATWEVRQTLPRTDPKGRAMMGVCAALSYDGGWMAVAARSRDDRDEFDLSQQEHHLWTFQVGGAGFAAVPAPIDRAPQFMAVSSTGSVLAYGMENTLYAWDMHATPPALVCKMSAEIEFSSMAFTRDDVLCLPCKLAAQTVVSLRLSLGALCELGVAEGDRGRKSPLAEELEGMLVVINAAFVAKECVVVTVD